MVSATPRRVSKPQSVSQRYHSRGERATPGRPNESCSRVKASPWSASSWSSSSRVQGRPCRARSRSRARPRAFCALPPGLAICPCSRLLRAGSSISHWKPVWARRPTAILAASITRLSSPSIPARFQRLSSARTASIQSSSEPRRSRGSTSSGALPSSRPGWVWASSSASRRAHQATTWSSGSPRRPALEAMPMSSLKAAARAFTTAAMPLSAGARRLASPSRRYVPRSVARASARRWVHRARSSPSAATLSRSVRSAGSKGRNSRAASKSRAAFSSRPSSRAARPASIRERAGSGAGAGAGSSWGAARASSRGSAESIAPQG